MRPIWCGFAVAASIAMGAVDAASAQEIKFGKEDYLKLCGGCHGPSGKGDGPNAKSLRKPPADLTKLSQNNNGTFPLMRVYETIDGKLEIVIHGPRDMPTFGEVLKKDIMTRMPQDYIDAEFAAAMARRRLLQVVEYLISLQSK
jgi:mono/diheme cytochrome c family protein